jgi:nicotinamidase-related amidase
MTSCLFVIDVQNGFINHNTSHVIGRIQQLIESNLFDHVVFTRFMNSKDSPFVKQLKWSRFFDISDIDIVDELKIFTNDVFDKKIYTSINEETIKFLKEKNISNAFVCGIDTECCVLATALDLFQINIHSVVLAHYSASKAGEQVHQAALTVLKRLLGSPNIIEAPIDANNIRDYLVLE